MSGHPFGGSGNLGPLPLPDYCEPERSIRMQAAGKLLGPGGVVRPDPLCAEICQEAARHGLRSVWTFRWSGRWTYPELMDIRATLARLAAGGPLRINGGLQAMLVGNEIDQYAATIDDAIPLAQDYLRDLAWFVGEIPPGLAAVDVFGPGLATSDKPGSERDRISRAILRHLLQQTLPERLAGVSLNTYPGELHGPDHPYLTMVRSVTDKCLRVMSAEFGLSCQNGEEHQAWVGMSAHVGDIPGPRLWRLAGVLEPIPDGHQIRPSQPLEHPQPHGHAHRLAQRWALLPGGGQTAHHR